MNELLYTLSLSNQIMTRTFSIAIALTLLCVGVWLALLEHYPNHQAGQRRQAPSSQEPDKSSAPVGKGDFINHRAWVFNRSPKRQTPDLAEDNPFAVANERIFSFNSDADYQKYLELMRQRGLNILGANARLRAIRVGYQSINDIADLLDEAENSLNFLVITPDPVPGNIQANAVAFGIDAVRRITGGLDQSGWGRGITVAVLDTGIASHPAFKNLSHIDIGVFDGSLHGHGTAVGSIIAGSHPATPGLAPEAHLLDVRIADANGISNSFTLAEGILAAVDNGAKVINISMGSYGDAQIVRNAIAHATRNGAVIIASAGNEGVNALAFPAAYQDVVSVGALDAVGAHLEFSNQAESLDFSAPGIGIPAAWPGDNVISFTGTSASAPFIAGAIAVTLAQSPHLSTTQATNLVRQFANEAGPIGHDPMFGGGTPDLFRIFNQGTPGIQDPAIASHFYTPPKDGSPIGTAEVIVQNQGGELLTDVGVAVNLNGRVREHYINQLNPGEARAISIPVNHLEAQSQGSFNISSQLLPNPSIQDARTENNQLTNQFLIAPPAQTN